MGADPKQAIAAEELAEPAGLTAAAIEVEVDRVRVAVAE